MTEMILKLVAFAFASTVVYLLGYSLYKFVQVLYYWTIDIGGS